MLDTMLRGATAAATVGGFGSARRVGGPRRFGEGIEYSKSSFALGGGSSRWLATRVKGGGGGHEASRRFTRQRKGVSLEVGGGRARRYGDVVRAALLGRTETETETVSTSRSVQQQQAGKKKDEVSPEMPYDAPAHPASQPPAAATPPPQDTKSAGVVVAGAVPLVTLLALLGTGVYYEDEIMSFLSWFIDVVESMGPVRGPGLFMSIYVVLEVLAVPAIPLTMSAGAIFGPAQGTAMVSVSATAAAAASFLIARYALRERIKEIADQNPKFRAIDNAIGEDSFRVVALLRLSPLLPFALSNYLYGLTSVRFKPYVAASWLGMLPGTFAYVSAGSVGRTMLEVGGDVGAGGPEWTHVAQVASGFGFTILSGGYVARLASEALKDVEEAMNSIEGDTRGGGPP